MTEKSHLYVSIFITCRTVSDLDICLHFKGKQLCHLQFFQGRLKEIKE